MATNVHSFLPLFPSSFFIPIPLSIATAFYCVIFKKLYNFLNLKFLI